MRVVRLFKALSDASRVRALCALQEKELCVCQIMELLGLAPSTVSKHMSVLANAGLVESTKKGRWVYFRLAKNDATEAGRILAFLPQMIIGEPQIDRDRQALARILTLDPEILCRQQSQRAEQLSKDPLDPVATLANPRRYSMFFPVLQTTIAAIIREFNNISPSRQTELGQVTAYIQRQVDEGRAVQLIFICTQNSRRSQMSQIWAQTAAAFYGIPKVRAFSGGTQATAFHPRALDALRRIGFEIVQTTAGRNPVFQVRCHENATGLNCFSKVYSDAPNPKTSFCAVMTCSQANEACPAVFGADARVSIAYEDPKVADGTTEEAAKYSECAMQIGREMFFLFSQVRK